MKAIQDSLKYGEYYINQLALKHKFLVLDLYRFKIKPYIKEDSMLSPYHGYGKPDKEFGGIAFYYLWEENRIMTFEEFMQSAICK